MIPVTDDELPETLVILSLRGGDEQLAHSLDKLARQDYPHYQLQIVIDHPADPVVDVVNRWLDTAPPVKVQVEFLRERMPNSTLKCSAVLQVLRQLDPRFQAVVLVDADANPYKLWLRDLVTPLLQPGVGAVSGNRWYFPADGSLGGWCRFVYNGLALAPMEWFGLIWAGSLAMRREVAQSELCLQTLAASSSDESAVRNAVRGLGLHIHFSSRVILWNPESTSVTGCFQFIFRQLLWTRLYHGCWRILFVHAVISYLLLISAVFIGVAELEWGQTTMAVWTTFGSLAIYAASVLFSLALLHGTIRRNILPSQESSNAMSPLGLSALIRVMGSLPVILAVYTLASVRAQIARIVVWRGVKYRVVPPNGLQIIKYQPFGEARSKTMMSFQDADALLGKIRHWEPKPLNEVDRAIKVIAEVSGSSSADVLTRLQKEHKDLGVNVREDLLRRRVPPNRFSDKLAEFYATTDAFLYETYCWNRYPLKQAMRKWIVAFLRRNFSGPARVLSFGDGLGFDSTSLALAGHQVTYFEIGCLNKAFSDRIFRDNHVQVVRCTCAEELPQEGFDVVICLDVLEHVPQPQDLVRQLAGWLKPGGFLIAHAPFWLLGEAFATHLSDNLRYSGDWRRLYGTSGLRIVDGTFMWNPLALQKAGGQNLISMSVRTWTKVAYGGFLLRCSRWCRFPLTWISRWIMHQERRDLLQNTVFPCALGESKVE